MLTSRRFLWSLAMLLGGLMIATAVGMVHQEIQHHRNRASRPSESPAVVALERLVQRFRDFDHDGDRRILKSKGNAYRAEFDANANQELDTADLQAHLATMLQNHPKGLTQLAWVELGGTPEGFLWLDGDLNGVLNASDLPQTSSRAKPQRSVVRDPRSGKELLLGEQERLWLDTWLEDNERRSLTYRDQRLHLGSFAEGRFGKLTSGNSVMRGFYEQRGDEYRILDIASLRVATASVLLTEVKLEPDAPPARWFRAVMGMAADQPLQFGAAARDLAAIPGAEWEARDLARRALIYQRTDQSLYPIAGVMMEAGAFKPIPPDSRPK